LPVAYRSRSYRVNITQNESGAIVGSFIGVRLSTNVPAANLSGFVSGTTLTLQFGVNELAANNVVENAYAFNGSGAIAGARISGSFVGGFSLLSDTFPPTEHVPGCDAADHQFVFVR
jgi:hypothetical protein